MKVDIQKLNMILARQCLSFSDLRKEGIAAQTQTRIRKGELITTKTLGKLCKALGVDPAEIIEQEES